MGRKRRLRQERRSHPDQTQTAMNPEARGHGLNAGADRRLTLFAFFTLLIGLVFLTPLLANKQSGELELLSDQVLVQLESKDTNALYPLFSSVFQEKYSPQGLSSWLSEKGLSEVKGLKKVWLQEGKSQAIVRARFEQADRVGLLSAFFVAPPKLSLQSRWELAQLCRVDQQAKELTTEFLTQLQNKRYQDAYALTADGVIKQSLYTPTAFAAHIQTLGLPLDGEWQWQALDSEEQLLVLHGTIKEKKYRFELLEKPDTCEYLILDFKEFHQES